MHGSSKTLNISLVVVVVVPFIIHLAQPCMCSFRAQPEKLHVRLKFLYPVRIFEVTFFLRRLRTAVVIGAQDELRPERICCKISLKGGDSYNIRLDGEMICSLLYFSTVRTNVSL